MFIAFVIGENRRRIDRLSKRINDRTVQKAGIWCIMLLQDELHLQLPAHQAGEKQITLAN